VKTFEAYLLENAFKTLLDKFVRGEASIDELVASAGDSASKIWQSAAQVYEAPGIKPRLKRQLLDALYAVYSQADDFNQDDPWF